MFNRKNKTNENLFNVVFDIRNSSLGAAIFSEENNTSNIIYTKRIYLPLKKDDQSNFLIDSMYKVFDELLEDIRKFKTENEIKSINRVNCIFSSPWYQAEVETLIFDEKMELVFTKDYLNKKIKKEEIKKDDNNTVLEDQILSTYLNGYEVINPYDKKFKQAKFAVYKSFISKNTDRNIKNKIFNTLKTKSIFLNSHPLAILSILKTNYHSINDFCLFDVGGEVTEVSIFSDGLFKELINIPKGFNYLIKEIAEKENIDTQAAISKIKLISEGELKDDKLNSFINKKIKEWFTEIKNIRKEEIQNVSKNIFITTDNNFEKIISDAMNQKEFYSEILELFIQPFIRVIDSINTKNLATYKDGITRDPILSILCNFSTIVF